MNHRHAKSIRRTAGGFILGSAMLSLGVAAGPGDGPGGPPGGPPGLPGIQGYEIVEVSQTVTLAPGDEGQFLTAFCPEGKKVLGGGRTFGGFFSIMNDAPLGDSAWQVLVVNRSDITTTASVGVFAICAEASD